MCVPSSRASSRRTYSLPMNPAPPVTSSRRGSGTAVGPVGRWRGESTGRVVVPCKLGGAQEAPDGARIGPVPVVDLGEQATARDVVVEHVGDLEFTATGRGESVDDIERVGAQEVHPDRDEV